MAIQFLSYRMRSIEEMNAYLQKKEIDPHWIADIIESLLKNQYLDDQRFAEMFVRDRMHQTSKGPQVINRELAEKGVNKHAIDAALVQFSEDIQKEHAAHRLEQERRKRSKDSLKKRDATVRIKMLQRGYSGSVGSAACQENPPTA